MSQEEYYDRVVQINMQINSGKQSPQTFYAAVLKEKLKDPKIKYYIDCSAYRARSLRQYAQFWKHLSNRNKFIMNIDDEELAEYVKKSQRSGRTVSKNDLIGPWEYEMSGKDVYHYDFMKSDSFSIKTKSHYANPFYSGDIIATYILGGKWDIEGDSLVLYYSPQSVKVEVDRSGITYREEMRDSVETFINNHFQVSQLTEMTSKSLESKKDTFGVSINKAGDKIEMVRGGSEDSDNGKVSSFYLKRVKNSTK